MILSFLRSYFPNAKNNVIKDMANTFPAAVAKYKVTPRSLAFALGQVKVESGGLTVFQENLFYSSASRVMEVFGVGRNSASVTAAEAPRLAKNPKALAMRVYGTGRKAATLGNRSPEDGWNYRGGGPIQLTGHGMYQQVSDATGIDFVNKPEYASNPSYFWDAIFGFFKVKGALRKLDQPITDESIRYVSRVTNGGTMHLNQRIEATYQATRLIAKYDAFEEIPPLRSATVAPVAAPTPKPPVVEAAPVNIPSPAAPAAAPVAIEVGDKLDPENLPEFGSDHVAVKIEDSRDAKEVEEVIAKSELVNSSVAAALPANPDNAILARYGDTDNPHVRDAQENLQKLNYWTGAIDGDYGALTRDALFAFQANNGFEVEAVLRLKHLQRFSTAPAQPLSEARQQATAKSPELFNSTILKMSRWIKKVAYTGLGVIGVTVAPDATGTDLMAKIYANKSDILPALDPVLRIIGTKYFIMGGLAIAAISIIVMAWKIDEDRVARHNDGSSLNR